MHPSQLLLKIKLQLSFTINTHKQTYLYLRALHASIHIYILNSYIHICIFVCLPFRCFNQKSSSTGVCVFTSISYFPWCCASFRSHISVWFDGFASACGVISIKENCFPPMVPSKSRKTALFWSLLVLLVFFFHVPLRVLKFTFLLCPSVMIIEQLNRHIWHWNWQLGIDNGRDNVKYDLGVLVVFFKQFLNFIGLHEIALMPFGPKRPFFKYPGPWSYILQDSCFGLYICSNDFFGHDIIWLLFCIKVIKNHSASIRPAV